MDKDNENVKIDDDTIEKIEIDDDVELPENLEKLLENESNNELKELDNLIEKKNVEETLEHDTNELLRDEEIKAQSENKNDDSYIESKNETNDIELIENKEEKNTNLESNNDKELDNLEENKPEKLENSIKNNNIQNNEMAEKIVNNLENEEKNRNKKNKHKKNVKNIFLLLGIVIELSLIIILIYKRNYVKNETPENIEKKLTCSNTIQDDNQDYSITTNNVYYFDDNNKVTKTQNSIIYIFNNKTSYDNYKNSVVDKPINFLGFEEKNIFDDLNYVYENKLIYDYSKLRKNEKVTFKNGAFNFRLPNDTSDTTIAIDTYDNIISINKNMGIICE